MINWKVISLLLLVFEIGCLSAMGYERELMRIGFEDSEGYSLGTVMGQNGWGTKDTRHNYETSINNIEEGIGPDGSRALHLEGSNNFPGFPIDLSLMDIDRETEYLAYSFKFRPMRDEAGHGGIDSYIKLCDASGSGWSWPPSLVEAKNWNGESFRCLGYNLAKGGNEWLILPYETNFWYNEIVYTLDLAKKRIVSWQVGSLVTNVPMAFVGQKTSDPNWGSFELYGYVDDIVIKAVSKPPTPGAKIETYTKKLVIGREAESFSFEVMNSGTNKVGYVVSMEGDPSWLEAQNGQGYINADGKVTLNFNILRDEMGDAYYRTTIYVDGGAGGVLSIPVSVQSGLCFYDDDFSSDFFKIGDISGQDRWYSDKSGTIDGAIGNGMAYNSMVITNMPFALDGEVARIICSGGYYGYECTIDTPSNIIVAVDFDFYWPTSSQAENFDVTGELWKHIPFTMNMRKSMENAYFTVTKLQGQSVPSELAELELECDAWHHLYYKLDFRQQKVMEVAIDETVCQPENLALQTYNDKVFYNLHTLNFGSDGVQKSHERETYVSGICLDNMRVYEVEREKKASLEAPERVCLGERREAWITLGNAGETPCSFKAEVLDGAPLELSCASGVVTSSFKLAVSRKGEPESGYHRHAVRFDAGTAGCLTTQVTFAQGGIYYTADFEEPYFSEGDIKGQDGWYYDPDAVQSNMLAKVEREGENSFLNYYSAGWYCGTLIPVDIPALTKFRFSARIRVPEEGEDEAVLYLKQFGHKPLQEFWVWRDKKEGLAKLYVKNYEEFELPPVSLGEWFDFSYTLDMGEERWLTTDIVFGDCVTNVENCQIYFENERSGESVDAISICSSGDLSEGKLANIQIDDIRVEDATLPEPAGLGLVWLLFLAFGLKSGKW